MTTTRIETLSLTDGRELRVTIAEPDSAVRGGLVVLHEARGMTAGVRTLVSSLADEGWLAIAPHLYDEDRVHGDDIRDQVSKLSGDRLLADTDVAFVWLGQQGVRFTPGGIRKGAAGHDVCFIHPKGDGGTAPIGGEGVLIELVQAPADVVAAFEAAGATATR